MATIGDLERVVAYWRVVPLATPRVWRRCPQCNVARRFASSDKFRLNAQQRRLDVWLIYRCTVCDAVWNRPLYERVRPDEIGEDRYRQLQYNDPASAWEYAFHVASAARSGLRVEWTVPVRTEVILNEPFAAGTAFQIILAMPPQCAPRLDRLLAATLCVSRSRLQSWFKQRMVAIVPDHPAALRRPAHDGQLLVFAENGGALAQAHNRRVIVVDAPSRYSP